MAVFGNSENGNDYSTLCANNSCGFYGNPKNKNLCSVCYAAFLKETGTRQSPCSETSEPVADLKSKNRCEICKKKVGLLGFNCRCGGSFCGKHRFPQEHSCGVDHKAIGRQILANQIVECKADKLDFRV